jgi:hypothetical protein
MKKIPKSLSKVKLQEQIDEEMYSSSYGEE